MVTSPKIYLEFKARIQSVVDENNEKFYDFTFKTFF